MKNNSKNKIAFYCSTDSEMIKYTISLYKSICKVYSNDEFDFYIVVDNSVNDEFLSEDNVFFLNIESSFEDSGLEYIKNVKLFNRISSLTYSRLFISKFVDSTKYQSIVYIDVDGIILKRIPEQLISDRNFAFFPENTPEKLIQSHKWITSNVKNDVMNNRVSELFLNKLYFQGGMIIINDIESYRKLEEKSLTYLSESHDIIDDQNLMNFFNQNNIEVLNMPEVNFRPDLSVKVESDEVVFLHFAGDNKPWNENFRTENYENFIDVIKEFI